MKTIVNGKKAKEISASENSKIDVIKNLLFGENISDYELEFKAIKTDILRKKEELNELIDFTRKELDAALDSLGTDLNIRITELQDNFNAKAEDLDSKKVDRKLLGDMLIKLGTDISD
jgi:molecular chaperone GrpE (heat shock protein)